MNDFSKLNNYRDMIFLNFDAFWGTVTLTFDLEVIQSFQTWRSLKSISDPEMEAIMCTVSEKAEWKKHLRTDGRTDKRTKRHMMKIIKDDFHHKKMKSFYSVHWWLVPVGQLGLVGQRVAPHMDGNQGRSTTSSSDSLQRNLHTQVSIYRVGNAFRLWWAF